MDNLEWRLKRYAQTGRASFVVSRRVILMGLLSPNARAAERQRIAARLIELGHKRQRATNAIADALVDIANCDDEADTLLGELAELSKPNPGALSGA